MTDARETLARILAQADAATEGPWEAKPETPTMAGAVWRLRIAGKPGIRMTVTEQQHGMENAEFIAASRTNVPRLVGALEKVLERHAPMPVYVLAEDCEAPDDHQHGSTPDGGDDICWDEPTGETHCRECLDRWGESVEYPCPTVEAVEAEVITMLRESADEEGLAKSQGLLGLERPDQKRMDTLHIRAALGSEGDQEPDVRERIRTVLAENGLSGVGELHDWRCGHPDRYPGYCTCVEGLIDDLVGVLARSTA